MTYAAAASFRAHLEGEDMDAIPCLLDTGSTTHSFVAVAWLVERGIKSYAARSVQVVVGDGITVIVDIAVCLKLRVGSHLVDTEFHVLSDCPVPIAIGRNI